MGLVDIETTAYLTRENVQLALLGLGAGALVAASAYRARGRAGLLVGVAAPALAVAVLGAGRSNEPDPVEIVAVAVVGLLTGHGHEVLRRRPPLTLSLLSLLVIAGGLWLAIPENDPVLAVAGALLGVALLGEARSPGVGYGFGVLLAWTALIGSREGDWSFPGGLGCLAPLAAVALLDLASRRTGRLSSWPWFVLGSIPVTVLAARWVGVAPDANWLRLAGVGLAAVVLAVVTGGRSARGGAQGR